MPQPISSSQFGYTHASENPDIITTMRHKESSCHFAVNFQLHLLTENDFSIVIEILLKFIHLDSIKNNSKLTRVMALHLTGKLAKMLPIIYETMQNSCSYMEEPAIKYIYIQYIPRHMHTVFALLWFVVVIHWLIFPYPSGLLYWHCGNLTIAPVPAKQPWWIWINTSCEFIMDDCITTTKQSTTKPCAYFLGYTVYIHIYIWCVYPQPKEIYLINDTNTTVNQHIHSWTLFFYSHINICNLNMYVPFILLHK